MNEKRKCPTCSTEVNAGNFCTACGAKLKTSVTAKRIKRISFGESESPIPWHKPSLWDRVKDMYEQVKDILISPETVVLVVLLLNLCMLYLNYIKSDTL